MLYGAGTLSPGDTAASDPMFAMSAEHPLVLASIGFFLPQSANSSLPENRNVLGMFVCTWNVRFVSIKPPAVSRPLSVPDGYDTQVVCTSAGKQVDADNEPQVKSRMDQVATL